ncbi:bacillithiol system redox-active protein YtxJ [Paenibacillus sp. ACRRX]|uniref:bacillithiol system redox-active protein YtxJ n=1 Tax=unclassified Paenibacillus TaxID=185978 RepID=UPI001EF517AF|nr:MULTISPECIES: bacillithiol system redox-active protein YtxJ [unclassified Paenibacillus]MCG7410383.1 bacillithiol system redox-active protein YtxJ [Paenibacillus sp. ACRRX]MDK8181212.1 bacillithiol system redox-active protein YtxJ [Paenibacillus sp. UMB4589-SE434]
MAGIMIVQSKEHLEQIIAETDVSPLFLYKHSSQCGSSRVAHASLNQFINKYGNVAARFQIFVIRVIEEKPLSDYVTAELKIPHLSPQILLIANRTVRWNATHQQINVANLRNVALHHLQSVNDAGDTP